jgi:hypothetical protein
MSDSITLINSLSGKQSYPAEFRIMQGKDLVARVSVPAGGQASVPSGNAYTVTATTSMGNITLKSNAVMFDSDSAHLLAQVRMNNPGLFDFELLQLGSVASGNAITCENTWREPVTFNVQRNGSPMAIVKVVDEHNTDSVSTEEQWDIYAIVDGITTLFVTTDNPNAAITVTADNNDDGYTLNLA